MNLTPSQVESVIIDCLVGNSDKPTEVIEGVVSTFVLRADKLKEHENEIIDMLSELPDTFRKSMGGGWSFLNMCQDRHGNLWTGEHRTMEQLVVLGMGIGMVTLLTPREIWHALPGGMPYYVIDL